MNQESALPPIKSAQPAQAQSEDKKDTSKSSGPTPQLTLSGSSEPDRDPTQVKQYQYRIMHRITTSSEEQKGQTSSPHDQPQNAQHPEDSTHPSKEQLATPAKKEEEKKEDSSDCKPTDFRDLVDVSSKEKLLPSGFKASPQLESQAPSLEQALMKPRPSREEAGFSSIGGIPIRYESKPLPEFTASPSAKLNNSRQRDSLGFPDPENSLDFTSRIYSSRQGLLQRNGNQHSSSPGLGEETPTHNNSILEMVLEEQNYISEHTLTDNPAVRKPLGSMRSSANSTMFDGLLSQDNLKGSTGSITFTEACLQKLQVRRTGWFHTGWSCFVAYLSWAQTLHYTFQAAFLPHLEESPEILVQVRSFNGWIEFFFFIDFIIQFFVSVGEMPDLQSEITSLLRHHLASTRCFADLAALVPMYAIVSSITDSSNARLTFFLKLLRFRQGRLFRECRVVNSILKKLKELRISYFLRKSDSQAENADVTMARQQRTWIILSPVAAYFLQFALFSWFLGLLLYAFISFVEENDLRKEEASFLEEFRLNVDKSGYPNLATIQMAYFISSTLSTVGLGDLHPTNSHERIAVSFCLLGGVIFAASMATTLTERIRKLSESEDAMNSGDGCQSLLRCFQALKQFNGQMDLSHRYKEGVLAHLRYREISDRGHLVRMMNQARCFRALPLWVKNQLASEIVFKDFLSLYRSTFEARNHASKLIKTLRKFDVQIKYGHLLKPLEMTSSLSLRNAAYMGLLMPILQLLEPRQIAQNRVILKAGDHPEEALFPLNFEAEIGYNLDYYIFESNLKKDHMSNSHIFRQVSKMNIEQQHLDYRFNNMRAKFHFPVTLQPGSAILGLFELAFQKQSQFIYKSAPGSKALRSDSLFIRKVNWQKMVNELDEERKSLFRPFKMQILLNYVRLIHTPIQADQDRFRLKMLKKEQLQSKISLHRNREEGSRFAPDRKASIIASLFQDELNSDEQAHGTDEPLEDVPIIRDILSKVQAYHEVVLELSERDQAHEKEIEQLEEKLSQSAASLFEAQRLYNKTQNELNQANSEIGYLSRRVRQLEGPAPAFPYTKKPSTPVFSQQRTEGVISNSRKKQMFQAGKQMTGKVPYQIKLPNESQCSEKSSNFHPIKEDEKEEFTLQENMSIKNSVSNVGGPNDFIPPTMAFEMKNQPEKKNVKLNQKQIDKQIDQWKRIKTEDLMDSIALQKKITAHKGDQVEGINLDAGGSIFNGGERPNIPREVTPKKQKAAKVPKKELLALQQKLTHPTAMMEGPENEMRISSGTGSFNPMDTVSKYSKISTKLPLGKHKNIDSPAADAVSEPSFKTESKIHQIMMENKQLHKKLNELLSGKHPDRQVNDYLNEFKKVQQLEMYSAISGFPLDDQPDPKQHFDYSTVNRFQPDHSISQIDGLRYHARENIVGVAQTAIPQIRNSEDEETQSIRTAIIKKDKNLISEKLNQNDLFNQTRTRSASMNPEARKRANIFQRRGDTSSDASSSLNLKLKVQPLDISAQKSGSFLGATLTPEPQGKAKANKRLPPLQKMSGVTNIQIMVEDSKSISFRKRGDPSTDEEMSKTGSNLKPSQGMMVANMQILSMDLVAKAESNKSLPKTNKENGPVGQQTSNGDIVFIDTSTNKQESSLILESVNGSSNLNHEQAKKLP